MERDFVIDKSLVSRRFAASVSCYDTEATSQREVVDCMMTLFHPMQDTPISRALEVGCGTGLLTQRMVSVLPSATDWTLMDLCPEVEPALRSKVGGKPLFIACDAEMAEWSGEYDLIASASCIQWWQGPLSFFAKSFRHTSSGGMLLFSTYGPANMKELRKVTGRGLHYHSLREVYEAMHSSGWSEIELQVYETLIYRDSLPDILRHLKRTGVNALPSASNHLPLTPGELSRMEEEYKREFGTPDQKLPLTYQAIIGKAIKS